MGVLSELGGYTTKSIIGVVATGYIKSLTPGHRPESFAKH